MFFNFSRRLTHSFLTAKLKVHPRHATRPRRHRSGGGPGALLLWEVTQFGFRFEAAGVGRIFNRPAWANHPAFPPPPLLHGLQKRVFCGASPSSSLEKETLGFHAKEGPPW